MSEETPPPFVSRRPRGTRFDPFVRKATELADNPLAKLIGSGLAWAFRLIVTAAIALAVYAGNQYFNEKTDARIVAHPAMMAARQAAADTQRRLEVIEPAGAANARNIESLTSSQQRVAEALGRIDQTIQGVGSTVAVVSTKLDDMKAQTEKDISRLDNRLYELAQKKD